MGIEPNVGFEKFPLQSVRVGERVYVVFGKLYQRAPLCGRIVRYDLKSPFVVIIKLDDGRYVLNDECQFREM